MNQQSNSAISTCSVLLVEDSHRFRELIQRKYLSGCEVTVLESGKRFADTLQKQDFHFILMDYQLPGEYSGEQLVKIARGAGYIGAIIGISSAESLNRDLLRAGADMSVEKRLHYQLPVTIRQALSIAEARGSGISCDFGNLR